MSRIHRGPQYFSLDYAAPGVEHQPAMIEALAGTGKVDARDGETIAFRYTAADRNLPVVALVHSLALDHRFWNPVTERLAGRAGVLAIDARGHGRSGRGGAPYTASQFAGDLADVMDNLGLQKAVVAGASMGGCVALQFAADRPDRTVGLALIDTTAWYGPTAPKDWEERAKKAEDGGLSSLVDFQLTRWFSESFREREPQLVRECVKTFCANSTDAYQAACRMLGAFDGRGLLASIRVPTRVLVGEEDYAAPVAMAKAMQEGIAGSKMIVIPNARHLTPLEVPDVVAHALLQLCAETAS